MKSQFSISKAVFSGIIATIIMTLFTYMGQLMNIKMNIPKMLSSMFGGNLMMGWLMHFMIGVFLAISYGAIFYTKLKIDSLWLRGAAFGILPWLMAQIIVMPMMSMMNGMPYSSGLFSGSFMLATGSFVGHLIFGAVVGFLYKPENKTIEEKGKLNIA